MTLREVSENLGKLAFDKDSNSTVFIVSLEKDLPSPVTVKTVGGIKGSVLPEDLVLLDSSIQEWYKVYQSTPVLTDSPQLDKSGSEPDPSSCAAPQPAPINQQESKPWFYRKTTKYLKLSDGEGAGSVSVDFLLTQSYGRIPMDEMGTELSLTFFNGFKFGQLNLNYEQIDQLRSLFY